MVIVFLENKQIVHSFCNKHKYLHIKLDLNYGKCPYLVQRSHHQLILFLMVCHSENLKTYEIWLLYSEKINKLCVHCAIKGQLQRFHKLISNDRIWPSEHGFEVIFEKSLFVFEISAFKVRNKAGSILGFTRFPKIIIGKPSSVTSQVINAP